MRVVISRHDVVHSGKANCQFLCRWIKIDPVIAEPFQVLAWPLPDVRTAFLKSDITSIQTFGDVGNCAAKMPKDLPDVGKSRDYAAKQKFGRCERCVERKAEQMGKSVIGHRLCTDGKAGVEVVTAFRRLAQSYRSHQHSSLKEAPLMLLKSITPLNPRLSHAR